MKNMYPNFHPRGLEQFQEGGIDTALIENANEEPAKASCASHERLDWFSQLVKHKDQ
jgi:hypothetical protein